MSNPAHDPWKKRQLTDAEVWDASFPDERIKKLFEVKQGNTVTKSIHKASKQAVNVDLKEMENSLKNSNNNLEKHMVHIKMILKRYEERIIQLEQKLNTLEGQISEIKRK